MIITDVILGGVLGALGVLVGAIGTIAYQEYSFKRSIRKETARARLEKIYGPLMLILRTNKGAGEEAFRWTAEEGKAIDGILLNNYYLIEERRRDALSELYSHRKFNTAKAKEQEIISSIKEGFEENGRKLGSARGGQD